MVYAVCCIVELQYHMSVVGVVRRVSALSLSNPSVLPYVGAARPEAHLIPPVIIRVAAMALLCDGWASGDCLLSWLLTAKLRHRLLCHSAQMSDFTFSWRAYIARWKPLTSPRSSTCLYCIIRFDKRHWPTNEKESRYLSFL